MKTLIKNIAAIIVTLSVTGVSMVQAATTATSGLSGCIATVLEVTSTALPAATNLDLS